MRLMTAIFESAANPEISDAGMHLQNHTAIITGAASGLGEATLRRFVGKGANAMILDVNDEGGAALMEELGNRVRFTHADVADEAAVSAAVDATVAAFGGVHILVNCGGSAAGPPRRTVGRDGPYPLPEFAEYIRSYLIGTFNTTRLAAHAMRRNDADGDGERGVVINTASVAAQDGQIGQAAYAAAKAGVTGMTLPLARDLAVLGVRVMTISPGFFDTPRGIATPENIRESLIAQTPFPTRPGIPDEFAHLAQEIVENSMLNGEVIRLDGGMRLGPK